MNRPNLADWLPITRKEVLKRDWDELDIVLVSGDAYVDHPSFGVAVIGRVIEQQGFRVGIITQPNWKDDLRDFKKLGKPRLFFGVTAGNMDSMVNHYTANKRLRRNDAYTAGGQAGFRPDYATTTYSRILKMLYPDVPVVIGGIEASLRRVTHYDYWADALNPSVLKDSGADLLVYGMGEQPLKRILELLEKGIPFDTLKTIPQTAYLQPVAEPVVKNKKWETLILASHEACQQDKIRYAENFKQIEKESNRTNAKRLTQQIGDQLLVINPPFPVMTSREIDDSFDLPYTRQPHPKYRKRGDIPAFEMIKFSLNLHRGCFGGCSFCTISAHQGKFIASRSPASILQELDAITRMPGFKGYLSDMGGPSANMYGMKGIDAVKCDRCVKPSCLHPRICQNLNIDHSSLLAVYQKISEHPKIKKAFVTSGIRYDLLVGTAAEELGGGSGLRYLDRIIGHHVSGRLKVAPEHTSDNVLKLMRKPSFKLFKELKKRFDAVCRQKNLDQQLIPYFISSHPGCTLEDMQDLADKTKEMGYRLQQVQDFTPTPMTVSTVIYYSGVHPYTLKTLYTASSKKEKLAQRDCFFWYKKRSKMGDPFFKF
ncbi:MAG: YgiQ family radical SAM protein [bacterium]|nr:YgiQ family radical SAM protein [bacterium]